MNKKTKNLIIDSILLALLIVASKLSIYTSFVPFTLQLLIVLIISLLVDYKNSLLIIAIYIIMGLIGIPVFSSTVSSVSVLVHPSFGFIIGFLFIALTIPIIKEKIKINNKFIKNLTLSIIALIIDYICGFVYVILLSKVLMIIDLDLTTFKIFINFIAIFIPFDIIKCVLATIIVKRVENSTIK